MECRPVTEKDIKGLISYFEQLSPRTKSFFAPHPFDESTVKSICSGQYPGCHAFVAEQDQLVIGYTLIRQGYTEGELYRFPNYPLQMDTEHHYLLAPSIADAYQFQGVGSAMLRIVEAKVQQLGATHLILWGGVQSCNAQAIRFYQKNGFFKLGEFHHQGLDNWDMAKALGA